MESTLLDQLQLTQRSLQQLSNSSYTTADKQALRAMLSSTIKCLQELYPDNFSFPQRVQLLHHLSLLEQEYFLLAPAVEVPLPEWKSLHESLLASVNTTLSNAAEHEH